MVEIGRCGLTKVRIYTHAFKGVSLPQTLIEFGNSARRYCTFRICVHENTHDDPNNRIN